MADKDDGEIHFATLRLCVYETKYNVYILQTICFSRRWNNKCDINQWLIKRTRKTTTIILLILFYCIIIFDSSAIHFPAFFIIPDRADKTRDYIEIENQFKLTLVTTACTVTFYIVRIAFID